MAIKHCDRVEGMEIRYQILELGWDLTRGDYRLPHSFRGRRKMNGFSDGDDENSSEEDVEEQFANWSF